MNQSVRYALFGVISFLLLNLILCLGNITDSRILMSVKGSANKVTFFSESESKDKRRLYFMQNGSQLFLLLMEVVVVRQRHPFMSTAEMSTGLVWQVIEIDGVTALLTKFPNAAIAQTAQEGVNFLKKKDSRQSCQDAASSHLLYCSEVTYLTKRNFLIQVSNIQEIKKTLIDGRLNRVEFVPLAPERVERAIRIFKSI